jgi:hypothetical protein
MKAKLVKKSDGWYNLYDGEIGIGSTHPELQGYKLSKQNCDEIFGVIDVDFLAEQHRLEYDNLPVIRYNSFTSGFNKAMELNKDKVFTLEDMRKAMDWVMAQYFEFHEQPSIGRREHYLQLLQQPIVIEVEIVMKDSIGITDLYTPDNDPKLDEKRCLILKKL